MNIRVYRVEYANGSKSYEFQVDDGAHYSFDKNLAVIAEKVRDFVDEHFTSKHSALSHGIKKFRVTIDFSPFHNMEHIGGHSPKRCFSLGSEKQEEFWNNYSK